MVTILALALFGYAAHRLVPTKERARGLVVAAITIALVCAAYGLLGASSTRTPSRYPLLFHPPRGVLRVQLEQVIEARATARGLLLVALVLAALVSGCAWLLRRRARSTRRSPARAPARAALGLPQLLALLLLAPYLLALAGALLGPARGFDALWYHLPMAVAFQRDHHLEPPGRDLVFYFPGNVELLARTLGDALGARALAVVQWPFAIGAALGAVALGRRLGLRRAAPFGAALVLSAPLVIHQSVLAYADVVALFCVAVGAALLVGATRAPALGTALPRALLGGLTLGVLLGSKYAALPLLATLLPVLALAALAPEGRLARRHLGRAALLLAVVGIGLLVPAWFWYVRNLRLTGNPVFPIDLPALGWRGLYGSTEFNRGKELELVAARWQWLFYPWIERTSHESGMGAAFAVLAPLGLPLLGLRLLGRLRRGRWPAFALPLGWGVLYLMAWWVGTPHEARHLLPLLVLLGVPALALLESGRPLGQSAFVAAALFSSVMTTRALLYSPTPELSARPPAAADLYDLPPELVAAIPDGATVMNRADRPHNFALYGPRLRWRIVEYQPKPPDEAELRRRGVDFVYYRGPAEAVPAFPGWRTIYRGPAKNLAWWDTRPGDLVVLLGRR